MDGHLKESRVPVEIAKIVLFCQSFEELVYERQREMVFAVSFVQFPVVYAHTPPGDNSCLKQFIVVTFYDCCASLLGYHMDGANPLAIGD